MNLEGRFSIIIPGAISQFICKQRGKPTVFVTYLGTFMVADHAKLLFNDEKLATTKTVVLPADLATPLLEITSLEHNAFYDLEDLDSETAARLVANSSVRRLESGYEARQKRVIDERLIEYEQSEKRKIQKLLMRLVTEEPLKDLLAGEK
jgi:hypothetical protein